MVATAVKPAVRQSPFAEPRVEIERRSDGSILLRNPLPLPPYARCVGEWLEGWATEAPERVFIAERRPGQSGWRELTYAEARTKVRALAAGLLQRGLSGERPVAVLSDNGMDHALLALAAMHVGIPVAAVSPAYSLMSADHAKLKTMVGFLKPGLIYVSDASVYGPALEAIAESHSAEVVASRGAGLGVLPFEQLAGDGYSESVDRAFAAVGPDTVARLLFTSGSTGAPKAVINTQRMLCSNQEAKAVCWPFLDQEPPVMVDWLPWSHTFGANHNLNMILRNGGSLYIDGGKPAPHLIATTIANLDEIGPTMLFNVPRGYDMLVEKLRDDEALGRRLFRNLKLIFYAGAALPQNLWEALEELSLRFTGRKIPMVSSWGSTETAPLATDCHFQADRSGNIGLPVPGTELKLVPNGAKLEIRVRGPNVTPGYWKNPELTREAFDEENYYIIGDAVRFANENDPAAGLFFDGRVSEDFKLSTGTWVSVGDLRVEGIAALDPIAQDIIVTGHDTAEAGFLVFPNLPACRRIAGAAEDMPARAVLDHPAVREHLRNGLARLKARNSGSSRHATRARLLDAPPAVDAGEITDKGYVNQRAVLERRASDVNLLQGDDRTAYVSLD